MNVGETGVATIPDSVHEVWEVIYRGYVIVMSFECYIRINIAIEKGGMVK